MSMTFETRFARLLGATGLLALTAACAEPLDFDMRGKLGAFSTAPAAQNASAPRPAPDPRGVISYPNYQVAVARRGDTVTSIASRVGLTPQELGRFNGLEPGQTLREGEILALPRRVSESPLQGPGGVDIAAVAGSAIDASPATAPASGVTTTSLPPATATPVAAAPAAPEPIRHKVARGETAYTVARLYNVQVKSLAEWNGLGPDFSIREGQYLLIPVAGAAVPRQVAAAAAPVTAPGIGSPTPIPPSAAQPLPEEKVEPAAAKPPSKPAVTVPTPSKETSSAMAFPVQGKIVRAYAKGRNEGIDISGTPGSAVKAAAGGTVAAITSSADKVPIVVVRHPDNLLTVYANVEDIKVKKGDSVSRGQALASLRAGDQAYVHFEVRDGFDSVDPLPYLE